MGLKIYDVELDEHREATQADIDMLTAAAQAYGKLRAFVAQTQGELMAEIERVKARGRPVVDVPDQSAEQRPD